MSHCERCIRAQDERDPLGAAGRRQMRTLWATLAPSMPTWTLPDDPDVAMTCIDCPACGGHFLVSVGERWCSKCSWELAQVERHEGAPVETGWKVGDLVQRGFTIGRVSYIDPSGFVDVLSSGWTVRVDDPRELAVYLPPWERGGGSKP